MSKVRKEVHARQSFAYDRALFWFKQIHHALKGGNILMCRAAKKYSQARRIYIHYANEFQKAQDLSLSK